MLVVVLFFVGVLVRAISASSTTAAAASAPQINPTTTVVVASAQNAISNYDRNGKEVGKRLSRKRRFLVFPEGSSLQLVYCLTMPSVAMADFFVFGWTAAIAWELPNKPYIGVSKNETMPEKESQNRVDPPSKTKLYYQKKQPLYSTLNKFGINVPPSTYSTILQLINKNWKKNQMGWVNKPTISTNKKPYNEQQMYNKIPYGERVTAYHDPMYREVHRRTRRELYPKIEKFLDMQQKDGKACLLKAICEVTKLPKGAEKGTFMQELIRVVFRVKEFHDPNEEHDHYDAAANEEHDCDEKYPSCDASVLSIF